jgi:hypothetical protein
MTESWEAWMASRLVPLQAEIIVHADFEALSEHLRFVRSMLDQEHGRLGRRIEELRQAIADDADLESRFGHVRDEDLRLQESLPSLQWMSTFLLTYGLFEKNMNSICAVSKKPEGVGIGLKDVAGQGIERAKTYLTKVCELTGPFNSLDWAEIVRLSKLRNLLAHASGEINKSEPRAKEVLDWCRQQPSIRVVSEDPDSNYVEIALTGDFVKAASETLYRFLRDLCHYKLPPLPPLAPTGS